MIKKSLFLLAVSMSVNVFSMNRSDFSLENIINNDKVQSFVAGGISAIARPLIFQSLATQPVRAASATTIIGLINLLNIFRSNEGKMKRLILTLIGAASISLIRNK